MKVICEMPDEAWKLLNEIAKGYGYPSFANQLKAYIEHTFRSHYETKLRQELEAKIVSITLPEINIEVE